MVPILVPVSMSFIAACAASLFVLNGYVGLYRSRIGVLRGDGGDPVLFKRIRIHGNFAETAPIAALVTLCAELAGLEAVWLWLAVLSFFIGRVLHYWLYDRRSRAIAMAMTSGPGVAMGAWLLVRLWWA